MNIKQVAVVVLPALLFISIGRADLKKNDAEGFTATHELLLPAVPKVLYDAMTGEIGGWWDHKFSQNPVSFRIEPKPGGGFYEIFDESGDGVLHGTVIYAQRGKRLTFTGPLGFNGRALNLVATYNYQAQGDSTLLIVEVNFTGQVTEEEAEIVDSVWKHFLFDGLKPFVEAGKHLE